MNYEQFGGQYVPNELKQKLNTIKIEFERSKKDPDFLKKYHYYLKDYIGRPSPLYYGGQKP